jgi:hypothetical protein
MCERILVTPANHIFIFSKVAVPGSAQVRVDIEGIGEDGITPINETFLQLSHIPTKTVNRYSEITYVHISLSQTYPTFTLASISNQLVFTDLMGNTLFESDDGFTSYYGRIFREDVEQQSNSPFTGEGTEEKFWYPAINLYNYSQYYQYRNITIKSSVGVGHIQPWNGDIPNQIDNNNYDAFVGPTINGNPLTYSTLRTLFSGEYGAKRLQLSPHKFTVLILKMPIEAIVNNVSLAEARIKLSYEYKANYDNYTSFLFETQ